MPVGSARVRGMLLKEESTSSGMKEILRCMMWGFIERGAGTVVELNVLCYEKMKSKNSIKE